MQTCDNAYNRRKSELGVLTVIPNPLFHKAERQGRGPCSPRHRLIPLPGPLGPSAKALLSSSGPAPLAQQQPQRLVHPQSQPRTCALPEAMGRGQWCRRGLREEAQLPQLCRLPAQVLRQKGVRRAQQGHEPQHRRAAGQESQRPPVRAARPHPWGAPVSLPPSVSDTF